MRDAISEDLGASGTRLGTHFGQILERFREFLLVFWWLVARMCADSVGDVGKCTNGRQISHIGALPVHMSRKVSGKA